jgi:type IV secretion system protein VirD4
LAVRIAYAPKDFGEANELSQELGNLTVRVKTVSKPLFDLFDRHGRRSRSVSISEQKRPLMLPQEIKELGRDHEILIYEGLRPVLAKKNRYFQDPRLRARLFPPPTSASPNPPPTLPATAVVAGSMSSVESSIEQSLRPSDPDAERAPRTREATMEDLERIDSLTLDDFAVDWSRVEIPQKADGESLTDGELQRAADSFLETIRGR